MLREAGNCIGPPSKATLRWRAAPKANTPTRMAPPMTKASDPVLALAGFVVGLSTRYGAGCTSGHGVCGLARLSPRSLVATLAFMASGFATVYVTRHLLAA